MWHLMNIVCARFSNSCLIPVPFLNGEFNDQSDLHIGDTKTKQSEKKTIDELNEKLRIEYTFYVNVIEFLFVYFKLIHRQLCALSAAIVLFCFFFRLFALYIFFFFSNLLWCGQ